MLAYKKAGLMVLWRVVPLVLLLAACWVVMTADPSVGSTHSQDKTTSQSEAHISYIYRFLKSIAVFLIPLTNMIINILRCETRNIIVNVNIIPPLLRDWTFLL
mgnify:CR=1 FL=1